MTKQLLAALLPIAMFVLQPAAIVKAQEDTLLKPTEVLYLSLKAMEDNPGAGRLETVSRFFERIDTNELGPAEEFARAEVSFVNLRPGESLYQFESFMDGNDFRARIAWQKSMQIQFRGYRRPELVEEMLVEYRERFQPDPTDVWDAWLQVANFASKYRDEGQHDKVVDIILEEIDRLPRNAPYRSFRLPVTFFGSFAAEGKADQALTLIREIRAEMQTQMQALKRENPNGLTLFVPVQHSAGTYYRMEDGLEGTALRPGYPSQSLRVRQYMRLISELGVYR